MRKLLMTFGALALLTFALSGCGKSESTTAASSDGLSSLNMTVSCGGSPCL
jgi:hypothetical protein